jgi:hypothetical protein
MRTQFCKGIFDFRDNEHQFESLEGTVSEMDDTFQFQLTEQEEEKGGAQGDEDVLYQKSSGLKGEQRIEIGGHLDDLEPDFEVL